MLRRQSVQVTGSWAFFRADLSAERISYLVRLDMVTDEGVANISAAVSAAVGGVQAWPLLPGRVTKSIIFCSHSRIIVGKKVFRLCVTLIDLKACEKKVLKIVSLELGKSL